MDQQNEIVNRVGKITDFVLKQSKEKRAVHPHSFLFWENPWPLLQYFWGVTCFSFLFRNVHGQHLQL